MAGRGDIEAGRAFVLIYMKDQLTKGLSAIMGKVRAMGAAMQSFGTVMTGIGLAALAGIGGAVKHFTDAGSALADMSARTGVAASTLAELKYAAEQTGAGLEDVEKAIAKAQKQGLSFNDVVDEIAAIEDPMKRTQAAVAAFGKSGTKLLPMINNLKQLRAEAQAKGLVPTDESVRMADELGDKFDSVFSTISASIYQIGAAIAPLLLPAMDLIQGIVGAVNNWIKENGALIRTVLGIVTGFTATGAAIAAIGATLSFLATPMGLVVAAVAAVAAGVAAWMRYTDRGKATFNEIARVFKQIGEWASAIGDALIGGNLEQAGQIVVKGLQLVFMTGIAAISKMFTGELGDTIGTIGTKLLGGDFAGAFQTALKQMQKWAQEFTEGLIAMFTVAARAVTDVWKNAVNRLTDMMLEASASGGIGGAVVSKILGVDMGEEAQRGAQLEQQRRARGLAPQGGDPVEEAKADARRITQAMADGINANLDSIDKAAQAATAEMTKALTDDTKGEANKAADAIARLTAELDDLKKKAAEGRVAALDRFKEAGPGDKGLEVGEKGKTFATFSAAALVASVSPHQSNEPEERAARAGEAALKKLDKMNVRLEKLDAALRLA